MRSSPGALETAYSLKSRPLVLGSVGVNSNQKINLGQQHSLELMHKGLLKGLVPVTSPSPVSPESLAGMLWKGGCG